MVDDDERDKLVEPIEELQEEPLARICALRATTLERHRARARALALYDDVRFGRALDPEEYRTERMTAALLRDLVGKDLGAARHRPAS